MKGMSRSACAVPGPATGSAAAPGQDRPDHDKFYPDIAVPLELVPISISRRVRIRASGSMSISLKGPRRGITRGIAVVQESGLLVGSIPVQLQVYNFTLPDVPAAKTMLDFHSSDINQRYLGSTYIDPNSAAGAQARLLRDRHLMMAHRHRLSLIGDIPGMIAIRPAINPVRIGCRGLKRKPLYRDNGYDGSGVGVGNNVYSIGTYGGWSWNTGTEADMDPYQCLGHMVQA